jgi:hypothetical protein
MTRGVRGIFAGLRARHKKKAEKAHVAGGSIKDELFGGCGEVAYHH